MKKTILGCLGVVTAIAAMQFVQAEVKAGDCNDCNPCTEVGFCDPCEPVGCCDADCGDRCNPCDNVFCDPCAPVCGTKKSLWFLGGHLEAGLYVNEYGRKNTYFNGGPGPDQFSGNTALLQNVHNSDFQGNQLYLNGGKKLSKRGWDVGGEVGVMYGTDARFAQSEGLEFGAGHGAWNDGDYYTAIAQAYAEVGYNNVSVKAGKFFTPMGHEGLLSPNRFFYSISNAFSLMPVTHSGVLATWEGGKLTAFGGWVNGENKFFNTSDDNAFLGGFNYKLNKRVSVGYSVLLGQDDTQEFDAQGFSFFPPGFWRVRQTGRDYFAGSLVVDVKLNKKWNYTFEWSLRNEDSGRGFGFNNRFVNVANWTKSYTGGYGINQELIYRYNKKWSFGFRAEWINRYRTFHNYTDINSASFYNRVGLNSDLYSFTLAANWTPNNWLLIRPELRYDKYDGSSFLPNRFPEKGGDWRNKQLSGGFSAIVKF